MLDKHERLFRISRWTERFEPDRIVLRPDGYDSLDTTDVPNHRLEMDRGVWKEMGSPSVLTVTIVPGDALNE